MPSESHAERVHPNVILAVLSLAGLAYAVLSSAVIPALPTIQRDLHTTETGVAWLLTGYLLSASVATSIIGRLGDMYGKERLLLWTLVVLAAGTLLGALSHSLGVLIVARVIQGSGGGIFPLAFAITRDEFPRERIAGSIGLMSSILGVGAGFGIVAGGLIVEHLSWQWLFWLPLVVTRDRGLLHVALHPGVAGASAGQGQLAGGGADECRHLLRADRGLGDDHVGLGLAEDTRALVRRLRHLRSVGLRRGAQPRAADRHVDDAHPRRVDDQPDRVPARRRHVLVIHHLPRVRAAGTGVGFGASVVDSGLYLLPSALAMGLLGSFAGRFARRFGSKFALVLGSGITATAFLWFAAVHSRPIDMLISAALLGAGIGLAFAALGNLIVQAVPPHQTGVASGMNTVMRTLGGALGGQIAATLIVDNTHHGTPALAGFIESFLLAGGFLVVCTLAALLVPSTRPTREEVPVEGQLVSVQEAG